MQLLYRKWKKIDDAYIGMTINRHISTLLCICIGIFKVVIFSVSAIAVLLVDIIMFEGLLTLCFLCAKC